MNGTMSFLFFVFYQVVQKHYLGGKMHQHLIAQSLRNAYAKNCESRKMFTLGTVKNVVDLF